MADRLEELLHETDEVEKRFLHLTIKDEFARAEAMDNIQLKHLISGPARKMYSSMLNWYALDKPINVLAIKSAIKSQSASDYLESVLATPTDIPIAELCKVLLNSYKIREVEEFCETTKKAIRREDVSGDELVDRMQSKALDISEVTKDKELVAFGDTFRETIEKAIAIGKGEIIPDRVPTGIAGLDAKLTGGGLRPKQFVIIAGRPAMGKSELALNIAIDHCYNDGGMAAFFSLEMGREELDTRILMNLTGIPAWRFGSGNFSDKHLTTLKKLHDKMARTQLFISDDPIIRPSQLHARAKRAKLMHPELSLIIVDYVQLITPQGNEGNREQEVSKISRGLKCMAMDLDIPVIGVAQLSRGPEHRKNKQPILSDLRETGALEQDCDIAIFCFRPYEYTKKDSDKRVMKLILAKQRNGPVGEVWVTNDTELQRIYQDGTEMFSDDDFDLGDREGDYNGT